MSIEKFNPVISGEAIPYLQANTFVVQNITNIEAGFVWIYLLTLPKDWIVVKSHIKKHFNIGDGKIKRIFAYLHKHGLIEYVQRRNETGKMEKSEIRVLNGSKFKIDTKQPSYPQILSGGTKTGGTETAPPVFTAGSKTVPPVFRTSGFRGTTNNISITNKETEQKKEKSFCKIEQKKANTQKHGFAASMDAAANERKHIEEHQKRKGLEMVKDGQLNGVVKSMDKYRQPTFEPLRTDTRNGDIRQTAKFWGPGHPDYDRINGITR